MSETERFVPDPNKRYSRSFNKKTGYTYVYEVLENYWDPVKKQARNKRRLVAKIDPQTGEMISTRKKVPEAKSEPDYEALFKEALSALAQKEAENQALLARLQTLNDQQADMMAALEKLLETISS